MRPHETIGSLFSGVGLLDLAVERVTGGRVLWQAELDPFRRAVLAKHWPDVHRVVDVRHIYQHDREIAWVDGIIGGFPCRGTSSAGKRAGLAHVESGLWSEYARILGELRPSWAFIENVGGLETRGLDRVLADLDRLGYSSRRCVLAARDVGAPHRRERIWILAYADAHGLERLRKAHDEHRCDASGDNDAGRGAAVVDWPPGPDPSNPAWYGWLDRNPGREPAIHRGPARGPGSMDGRRRRQRLAALGDSVCVPQAVAALTGLICVP